MGHPTVHKTYEEINERIRKGEAVVVTAEEIIAIVEEKGVRQAAKEVDVVTTGTFAPMCSSGAVVNFGHTSPKIKSHRAWLNNVPAYAALGAADLYIGATNPAEDDPLNKVYPGSFEYGGGHVIHDLVAGEEIALVVEGYGTDCYPNRRVEKRITVHDLVSAFLFNPRNACQNYNGAINLSEKVIYTYMGTLKPHGGNINYCSAGQLSPLLNDPYYRTIGVGTKIFLGGGEGFVVWHGTQHNPQVSRGANGVVKGPAGTIATVGDLRGMKPEWLRGGSIQGYGTTLIVAIGIPIPILDEEMARFAAVKDKDIYTQIVDFGADYPQGISKSYGEVSYQELKSGQVVFNGKEVPTAPLSSYLKAREIAAILKAWIQEGQFTLGVPQKTLPSEEP